MRTSNIFQCIFILSALCTLIAFISACTTSDTMSDSQWKTELELLQATVDAQYHNPIFDRLFAQPRRMNDIEGTYDIVATFVTDNGQLVEALYEANNITGTLQLEDTGIVQGQRREIIVQERERRAMLLNSITVSPQEAIKIATQHHANFYTEHTSTISIISVLRHEPTIIEVFDTPVAWFVSLYISDSEERFIWVDAVTGEIVSEMRDPFEHYPNSP